MSVNPLAQKLNEQIEQASPPVAQMLSALGRRLYFPKGILSQSAEAKQKAHRFNATIGIATEHGGPMHLPSIQSHISAIAPADAYTYAPPGGRPGLRAAWREKQLAENPSLADKQFGKPIVTAALTHGLSLVGDLFIDPGDVIVLPDKLWGNYRLGYEVRFGARIETFPFYAGQGFNTEGFAVALAAAASEAAENPAGGQKLIVLLNFPNNPTGYMPSENEGRAIVEALVAQARKGTRLVVVTDDAYFGLFYHLGGPSMTESLFGLLTGQHPNLLAVKLDGATKELFVWGLRVGFITFGPGDAASAEAVCQVLDAKVRGAIRGAISNAPQLSQSLIEKALASPELAEERRQKCQTLSLRAEKVFEVANAPRFKESWEVYPFNSGYFMCLKVTGVEAEALRVHLLEEHGVGLIATGPHDIRIAFSCLELDEIEPLFEAVHQAAQKLR